MNQTQPTRRRAITKGRSTTATLHGGRWWFRLDHLKLVVRAEVARDRRQVSR